MGQRMEEPLLKRGAKVHLKVVARPNFSLIPNNQPSRIYMQLRRDLCGYAMSTKALPHITVPFLNSVLGQWRGLEHGHKWSSAIAIVVICAAVYGCSLAAHYIEDLFANKAGASTALYMDSFIEPLVQELASGSSLAPENRSSLERRLAPASIGKPVVSFRIWVGDQIVFSDYAELVGKQFPTTVARERAFMGDVVAKFGADGEDDKHEQALGVPILEVYAPIRQIGTNRIIALAETYQLAIDLSREIETAKHTSYVIIASMATGLLLVIFTLTNQLQNRIGELARQTARDEKFKMHVCSANRNMLETNERNLRRVGDELYAGPLQLVAFAQLRLDALREAPDKLDAEIATISEALTECRKQIRNVLGGMAPSGLESLSLPKVISTAVCVNELRTNSEVSCSFRDLPQDPSLSLKTCIYQFIEQGLTSIFQEASGHKIHVVAECEEERLEIVIFYHPQHTEPSPLSAIETASADLRHRIEALGGALAVQSGAGKESSIRASFWIGKSANG
jgi:signal transduction histidine kinase